MKNKPHIFFYHNGARGDFLISILLGDCLAGNENGAWIRPNGADPELYKKFHSIKYLLALDKKTFESYISIRIKFESYKDVEDALVLARTKMVDYICQIEDGLNFEKNFSRVDNVFTKIIPFRHLFDIDKLESLFFEYHGREMNLCERQRVVDNIKLNSDILHTWYGAV
jgi:hypothetical protein